MTDFKSIPLSEIHPDKNQPRKFFDDHSLQELTDSIREKGVLQPIMVRPNGNGYILVCGERRYRASVAVQTAFKTRNEIPAVIRNLTDEEALEIQFIENIQRADVHPMDEASTFKQMMESKVHPYTIADIAAKINKPESFVAHRLVLNNLIPSLQKEFWSGKFLIGHAILFARLSPEDQKQVDKDCREWSSKEFKSVNEVRSYIDRYIMNNLSSATFKKDDASLNPEMGACTTCQFRSGANATLFNDIKETDRCFKPVCFQKKSNAGLILQVKTLIEEHPETIFLDYSYSVETLPEIKKMLNDFKIKALKHNDHFTTYQNSGYKKAKGFWINGSNSGKFETVYLRTFESDKSSSKDASEDSVTSFDMEITGIKQRTTRAAELDDEKVWLRIHSEVVNINKGNGADINMELINGKKLSSLDTAAMIYAMQDKAGSECQEILKLFGFNIYSLYGKEGFKFFNKILTATPEQFNQVCRIFIKGVLDSAVGSHTANAGLGILKQVAEQYKKPDIEAIEAEQKEKRDKREQRAASRIKVLQEKKKEAKKATPKKAEPVAKKKAPAAKKSAPKKSAAKPKSKGKGIKALLK